MRKYFYIYKSELMTNLQYAFDMVFGFISYLLMIFIFMNLWQYMYSDPSQLINGYNQNQMIWYVIITEIVWTCLEGRKLCKKISSDVRSGNIAYNINKPYNYVEYALFNHLGTVTVRFLIGTILGIGFGLLFLQQIPALTILQILGVLLTSLFAILINMFLLISIGLLSFFIEDSNPFYWLYSKMIIVIGVVFPIEFFPKIIQPILRYSPIYAVCYGPAKLFVQFSTGQFIEVLITQIIYLIISFSICHLIYKKGVRKLNVNGG